MGIYRKKALAHIASLEQLDRMIIVARPTGWLSLAAVGAILASALAWGIWGSVPVEIHGRGIIVRRGGILEVTASTGGQLAEVSVEPGSVVHRGQVVARVARPDLIEDIAVARSDLSAACALRDELQENASSEGMGLTEGERAVRELEQAVERLESKLLLHTQIVSQVTGRVVEVACAASQPVVAGSVLLRLEPLDEPLLAIVYINARDGQRVRRGMEADISPTTVPREEYGSVLGLVTNVSPYPVSQQSMLRVLGGNPELVASLSGGGAPIAVTVDMVPDLDAPSGFKWTSAGGPDEQIHSGTLCGARVVVSRVRPIGLVIPAFGKEE